MAWAAEVRSLPEGPIPLEAVVEKDYNQSGVASSVDAHMVCLDTLQWVVLPIAQRWDSLYSRKKTRWYLAR